MFDRVAGDVVTIIIAIIGVAMLAVIVGRNSQTANVINAGGSALSSLLKVAVSPVA